MTLQRSARGLSLSLPAMYILLLYWAQWKTMKITPYPVDLTFSSAKSHEPDGCDAGWGNFSKEDELRSTQKLFSGTSQAKLDDKILQEIEHRSSKEVENLVIHQPSKFAFCQIQKNESSQWPTVLLVNDNVNIQGPHYFLGKDSQENFGGLQTVKRMLSDPETFVVVTVRDHLSRFASAYLNKCFDVNCSNSFCYARSHFKIPPGTPTNFRLTLEWFLHFTNPDPSLMDPHWGNAVGEGVRTKENTTLV